MNLPFLLKIIIFFLIASSSSLATAQRTITTFGARSCEKWLEDKRAAALSSPTELRWVSVQMTNSWLAGYVTGYNENYSEDKDLIGLVDLSIIEDWVDSYCKKNPKSGVRQGVHKLLDELSKLKR